MRRRFVRRWRVVRVFVYADLDSWGVSSFWVIWERRDKSVEGGFWEEKKYEAILGSRVRSLVRSMIAK